MYKKKYLMKVNRQSQWGGWGKPKIITEQHSTKARLCTRGFEEPQCFWADSPTCSREGIRITLATTVSRKWKLQSLNTQHSSKENKSRKMFFSFHWKKSIPTTFGISKNCIHELAETLIYPVNQNYYMLHWWCNMKWNSILL